MSLYKIKVNGLYYPSFVKICHNQLTVPLSKRNWVCIPVNFLLFFTSFGLFDKADDYYVVQYRTYCKRTQ